MPACWYLLSNAPDTSHGHANHGDDHGKSHGEEEEETEEQSKDEPEEKSEETADEKGDGEDSEKPADSDSEDEAKEADTPDTSEDEGEEGPKKDSNTTKSFPDAKGGNKKRIESDKGIKQGQVATEGRDGEPKDKVCEEQPLLNSIDH